MIGREGAEASPIHRLFANNCVQLIRRGCGPHATLFQGPTGIQGDLTTSIQRPPLRAKGEGFALAMPTLCRGEFIFRGSSRESAAGTERHLPFPRAFGFVRWQLLLPPSLPGATGTAPGAQSARTRVQNCNTLLHPAAVKDL